MPIADAAQMGSSWLVVLDIEAGQTVLRLTHMFVMEVIVRPQDRALCASITCITGIMRPEGRT